MWSEICVTPSRSSSLEPHLESPPEVHFLRAQTSRLHTTCYQPLSVNLHSDHDPAGAVNHQAVLASDRRHFEDVKRGGQSISMLRPRTRLPRASTSLYKAQAAQLSAAPSPAPEAPPIPARAEAVLLVAEALNKLIAADAHGLLLLGGSANMPAELTFK